MKRADGEKGYKVGEREVGLTPLGSHSRFGDILSLIPSNLSPKRGCGPKGVNKRQDREAEKGVRERKKTIEYDN